MKLRLPLLVWVVVALAAMGSLPIAITYYQLWTNKDALYDQVVRTHIVATKAAAAEVDTYFRGLLAVAKSTAAHPVLLENPKSPAAQQLVSGVLQFHPTVVLAAVFNAAGENVLMVRRKDLAEEIGDRYAQEDPREPAADPPREPAADDPRELSVIRGATRRWLEVRAPLPREQGRLVLLADTEVLDETVRAVELGREAQLALASRDGSALFGAGLTLDAFPASVVEHARSGKLSSEGREYDDARLGNQIVGHAALESAPWFVLSIQPAAVAQVAQEKIRRTTRLAALAAVLLTAALSAFAYVTTVRPIRRLAAAQSELLGEGAARGGSEIDRLEASFELLQQRVRDSEDLGKVFLGRYQVTDLVGSGAMGSVFQGWDPQLKRDLALKTIRVNSEDVDQQKLIAGLMDEAAISASFHHPNIVTVYDVMQEGNAAFIAMEYVDGTNLEKYLSVAGTLEPDQVIPLGAAIARALATAHENELVHHDVKPANVLIGRDQSIKVTDFGISELISAASRSDDVICGTPGYIAPECFMGEPYTPSADLFALGLILYEALVGRHPFQARSLRETILNTATVQPEPIESFRGDVDPELSALIEKLMAKEPSDRPTSAAAVAEQLEEMARARNLTWSVEDLDVRPPPDAAEKALERTQLFNRSVTRS